MLGFLLLSQGLQRNYITLKNNQRYHNYKLSSAGITAGLFSAYSVQRPPGRN